MRVCWTPPALEDLDAIQDYIAAENPFAAYRLINELMDRAERSLAQAPRAGRPGRIADTREFVFSNFPYIVVYRVEEVVEILAVMHTARDWPETFDR